MSRKQSTWQIIKERLAVLAVIISCLALVFVSQEGRRLFQSQPPTATPTVAAPTPTPRSQLQTAEVTAPPPTTGRNEQSTPPVSTPAKPVNLTGKWVGLFSETVDGNAYEYRYTLELSQQGNIVAGKSTIEKEDDPEAFVRFVIRGQMVQNPAGAGVKFTEDLLAAKNLNSGSAAGPRTTQLSYVSTDGQEYLEGEWVDRRHSAQNVAGQVTLTKQ